MEAILLAAGEGSRLRPFTVDKPKPMVRAGNKPIAQHAIEALVANGVKDITIVVGYQRAKVQSYFGNGHRFGADIRYVFQEVLAGTAMALAATPPPSGPFLVLGADNIVDADLMKAVLDGPEDVPAIAVRRSEDPSRYGVVSVEAGRVTRIEEKPAMPRSDQISTGVYRFPAAFHARVARSVAQGQFAITDVVREALAEGERVDAVKASGLWADAIYPWDLLNVHAALLRAGHQLPRMLPGAHVEPDTIIGEDTRAGPGTYLGSGTCVGRNAVIHPNCVIENTVIYDDVEIGPGSIVRNSIIGEGSRLAARVTIDPGPCEIRTAHSWHALDEFGAVIGEDCRIGTATTLMAGAFVGNRVRIGPGRLVQGSVEDDAVVL